MIDRVWPRMARHRDGECGRCVGSSVLWSCLLRRPARAPETSTCCAARNPWATPPIRAGAGFTAAALIGEEFDAADFRNVGQSEITTISGLSAGFDGIPLSNFPRLTSLNTNTPSYSAFVGYNYQFEAAVVGFELTFTKTSFSASINDVESHSYFQPPTTSSTTRRTT